MRWGDMDAQAHVNNAAFVDYLQEARVDFLLTGPPVMHELLETGVLVVQHQIEYLHPVRFHDRGLAIDLWVEGAGASRFVGRRPWRSAGGPARRRQRERCAVGPRRARVDARHEW